MRFSLRTEWPHLLLLAAMLALAGLSWSWAPSRIPVQWNLQGRADGFGGKFEGLFAIPLLALGLYLLCTFLPRIDPGRANYDSFASAYATLRLAIVALLAAVYGLVHLSIRGVLVRMETWLPFIVGVLFVVLGNLMGKLRPNWFVGIRTPWTLSSKRAWQKTHRAGGWAFILMGVTLMALGVGQVSWMNVALPVILFGGTGGLAAYSYLVWRTDPDRVPPAGTSPAEE